MIGISTTNLKLNIRIKRSCMHKPFFFFFNGIERTNKSVIDYRNCDIDSGINVDPVVKTINVTISFNAAKKKKIEFNGGSYNRSIYWMMMMKVMRRARYYYHHLHKCCACVIFIDFKSFIFLPFRKGHVQIQPIWWHDIQQQIESTCVQWPLNYSKLIDAKRLFRHSCISIQWFNRKGFYSYVNSWK